MKKKLTNNLGMKILSLAIAFLTWIIIINIDDPVITKTFPQISVEIKNEEAIQSLNQVYEVVSGDVVNITVKGKRSVVDSLRSSDFKATADLSKLSSVFAVPIAPSITKNINHDVELSLGKVDTLIVKLEDIEEKQFQVTVVQKGNIDDGYSIGDIKVKPNLIRVSGAKSQISRIDQVRVELDVSNVSDSIEMLLEPKVYDVNGYLIDSSNMKFSSQKIKLTAELLNTKTVPLVFQTTGEPETDYKFVNIEYEPKKVTIAGKQSDLDMVKNIEIKLDITDATENIEEEIILEDYLPEGIKLVSDSQTAMVKVDIEKLMLNSITIQESDIKTKNLAPNFVYHFKNQPNVSVNIKGLRDAMVNLNNTDLQPYIDFSDLDIGEHTVEILFDYTGDVEIVSKPKVRIVIEDMEDASITNEVEPTDTSIDTNNTNDGNESNEINRGGSNNNDNNEVPTTTKGL